MEEGIVPLSWLFQKSKYSRLTRLPIEAGRVPDKLLAFKFIVITLEPDTIIPYQVLTGFVVNQLLFSNHPGPLVLLYKSTNARESFTSTCALAISKLFTANANNKQERIEQCFMV